MPKPNKLSKKAAGQNPNKTWPGIRGLLTLSVLPVMHRHTSEALDERRPDPTPRPPSTLTLPRLPRDLSAERPSCDELGRHRNINHQQCQKQKR
ncbi:hypothetical protein ASPZODRAFT_13582 [Penicilliopsis zonata CBS 506.65]|uniref:Uncharacterized protein n=1 Tax=Penicilliopsis zonata CBS 506.65 TaxID=1073090 RepID=A0A1L9SNN9_9EURO|nr:hypothetical protein ASPZODRAFT_13582 [Penicilliopsis zonata CBS 506.65]OJJ48845.1 hypothetical protein ASPZODRAFT_13582 [Penicilliopsis zonata CBS 506.65]